MPNVSSCADAVGPWVRSPGQEVERYRGCSCRGSVAQIGKKHLSRCERRRPRGRPRERGIARLGGSPSTGWACPGQAKRVQGRRTQTNSECVVARRGRKIAGQTDRRRLGPTYQLSLTGQLENEVLAHGCQSGRSRLRRCRGAEVGTRSLEPVCDRRRQTSYRWVWLPQLKGAGGHGQRGRIAHLHGGGLGHALYSSSVAEAATAKNRGICGRR
jgi:hypothetical protein